jgi:uncharacterized protein (DUF488 family)
MEITICTIGFAGKTAEEFFRLLHDAGVRKVIDIRENRGGQLSGFAKYPDLEFFLQRIAGIEYQYQPLLAPSAEIRRAYRSTKDWAEYERAFLALMRERSVPEVIGAAEFEGTVALLCSEPGPEKCHRRLIADLLALRWHEKGHPVQVRHLVKEKVSRGKRRSARR